MAILRWLWCLLDRFEIGFRVDEIVIGALGLVLTGAALTDKPGLSSAMGGWGFICLSYVATRRIVRSGL